MYVCMCVCIYVCVYVCVYVCMCVCVYVCMCACILLFLMNSCYVGIMGRLQREPFQRTEGTFFLSTALNRGVPYCSIHKIVNTEIYQ